MEDFRLSAEWADLPYWLQIGDHPWYSELNDRPQDFVLVEGREVGVAQSVAQGVQTVDMDYWPRWLEAIGILAIPLIASGLARERRLSLQIHEVDLPSTSRPIFVVRRGGFTILRTTNFELAREVIRHEITKR